ncbi:MAG: hypothetical protein EOM12_11690 [Verrucomicrobiae bacterium]|nr:hypothetical protein [Verrucomicrobiae bacterium]
MPVRVNDVEALKEYFSGVVARSEHHAPNVNEVIYTLLGLIILSMDENSNIQVRGSEGVTGNMLWFTVNGTRYAFRYEHSDDTVEIRKIVIKENWLLKLTTQH